MRQFQQSKHGVVLYNYFVNLSRNTCQSGLVMEIWICSDNFFLFIESIGITNWNSFEMTRRQINLLGLHMIIIIYQCVLIRNFTTVIYRVHYGNHNSYGYIRDKYISRQKPTTDITGLW